MRGIALVLGAVLLLIAPFAAADHVPSRAKSLQELALYHTWPSLTKELMDLQQAHSDIMTVTSIGKSVLGMDLWGVHLVKPDGIPVENRERIYVDGGIHANEQLGMELAFAFVKLLAEGYGKDANATWILDHRDVYIVPMVNPDGNTRDARVNMRLVDLNRNFPFGWGGEGTSDMPGSGNYRGPSPASEPETKAVIAAIQAFDPDYLQSYHTGTTMFLHPWGGNDTAVPDRPVYDRICAEISTIPGADQFPCGDIYTTIYPATGTTADFGYGNLGAISFTFEVDDEQSLYVSLESIRTRLNAPFEATLHAFMNAEKYGSNPVIAALERDGENLRVVVENQGYGDSGSNRLRIASPDGATVYLDEELGRVAAGTAIARVVPVPASAEQLRLSTTYEKTNYLPNIKSKEVVVDITGLAAGLAPAVVEDSGLALALPLEDMPLTPAGADTEDTPLPGLWAILGLMALAGAGRRRR